MLAILFLASGSFAMAQDDHRNAPENVRQSFHKDFPDANNASWSRNNTQWHARFNDRSADDRGEMVAYYDQYGHHIDSHIRYDYNDVPSAVVERTHRNYPGGTDYTYTRIERPVGQPLFQVELNLQNKNKRLYVDEYGHEQKYHDHH